MIATAIVFATNASADNAAGSTSASAPGDWQFGASAYLWGASIGGDSATGGEIDISFIDIINNLDIALMGHFDAAKGKWRLSADAIYMDISATNGNNRLTARPGLSASSDSKLSMKAWNFDETAGLDNLNLKGPMAGVTYRF